MIPFSSCVCQQYNKWFILHNETIPSDTVVQSDYANTLQEGQEITQNKNLCQLFLEIRQTKNDISSTILSSQSPTLVLSPSPPPPSSSLSSSLSSPPPSPSVSSASSYLPNQIYIIPHITDEINPSMPITYPTNNNSNNNNNNNNNRNDQHQKNGSDSGKYCNSYYNNQLLSTADTDLIERALQRDNRSRLLKIQRQRKFVRRRNSFKISKKIKVSNPDSFGLVDMSNFVLGEEYLEKSINNWSFNVFRLDRFTGGHSSLIRVSMKIFEVHNLINHFSLKHEQLIQFFASIQEVYHSFNPYHNSLHAADVAQAMHCFLIQDKIRVFSQPMDVLGCILSALCHDADHPGQNQIYLEKINHFFIHFYNHSSVLENHHIRVTLSLLNRSSLLKESLSKDEWLRLTSTITNMILATDIAHQKSYLSKFTNLIRENKSTQELSLDDKTLIYQVALKCSDISNPCRCWPVTLGWATLVCEEFFLQGDVEKKQGLSVLPTHDRCMTTKADIQLSFIRFIVRPLMAQWNSYIRSSLTLQLEQHVDRNLANWEVYKQRYSLVTTMSNEKNSIIINPNRSNILPGIPAINLSLLSNEMSVPPPSCGYSPAPSNNTNTIFMDTLTEESTMSSSLCSGSTIRLTNPYSSQHQINQSNLRRHSLPDNNRLSTSSNRTSPAVATTTSALTTLTTNPISSITSSSLVKSPANTLHSTYRRGSLPPQQHSIKASQPPSNVSGSRRRGSLPLNVRGAIPIPSAWEDNNNNTRHFPTNSTGKGGSVPKQIVKPTNSSIYTRNQRRGSAPIITTARGGIDSCSISCVRPSVPSTLETGLISTCSRERLLLEVYWMAAAAGASSSSVSSCTSLHGAISPGNVLSAGCGGISSGFGGGSGCIHIPNANTVVPASTSTTNSATGCHDNNNNNAVIML